MNPPRLLCTAAAALLLAACTGAPAPPPAPPPPPAEPEPSQVVVAVDELGAGFNPHLLAHQSTVTTALAGLALPSVFRPDPTGNLQLDRTVATSAAVISDDPFTVSYELDLQASWTSARKSAATSAAGAPIAAPSRASRRWDTT